MKKIAKIKLLCATGGYGFGDVVETSKDGITNEVANDLVGEGLAIEVAGEATTSSSKVEADKIIADAQVEAENLIKNAKEVIVDLTKVATDDINKIKADAETEAEGIVSDAETDAAQIKAERLSNGLKHLI